MLAGVVIAAFYTAGLAVIGHLWALFWACAGLVVLAILDRTLIAIRPAQRLGRWQQRAAAADDEVSQPLGSVRGLSVALPPVTPSV